ncbi:MAG: ribonuclease H-like YkuK family protein [Patescibacteria group bacterium]
MNDLIDAENAENDLTLSAFKTASGIKLETNTLIKEINDFIKVDPNFGYRILVGTDSETNNGYIDFVTAIVVHRVGQGARYFWKRKISNKRLELHQRLWEEALFSLDISQKLLGLLVDIRKDFRFELHLDLGTKGKSNSVVKEITNLIRSYGMDVKIKPESYAASKIADRLI